MVNYAAVKQTLKKKRRVSRQKKTKKKKKDLIYHTLKKPCKIENMPKCLDSRNPVVGILTLPVPPSSKAHAHSFLPQSCVKWLEMSGARVMPIQYDLPTNVIRSLLHQCNGFVTWGEQLGSLSVGLNIRGNRERTFYRALDDIYLYILSSNMRGNYYPMMGIADGMQTIANSATFGKLRSKKKITDKMLKETKTKDISKVNAENMAIPIKFTKNKSGIKQVFTKEEIKKMATENIVYTNHTLGYVVGAPYMHIYLESSGTMDPTKMEIDAIATGKRGKKYVLIYSYKHLPIYGLDFFPNLTLFDWDTQPFQKIEKKKDEEQIPRSPFARKISKKISQFFVDQCKKNVNRLNDNKLLIYNYTLYGVSKIKEILFPNQSIYKYHHFNFENAYYFNIVRY